MGRHGSKVVDRTVTGSVRVVTDARGRTDLRITGPFYDAPPSTSDRDRAGRQTVSRSAARLLGLVH